MKIHGGQSEPPESVSSHLMNHRQLRFTSSVQDVQMCQDVILLTEEALLEALCFDFIVESPHEVMVDILEKHMPEETDKALCDVAWSLAHDSYVP